MLSIDQLPEDRLVSLKEAAEVLGYCLDTVRRMHRSGTLIGIKGPGRNAHIKFRVGDLKAYIRGEYRTRKVEEE